MFFSALIFVALKCMCYFWEIPEFYSSLSTVIAKNWETILKCLLFLFSNKINRNSKTNWVDEKLENLLKTMGGSRIPECHWFQPRISFPFFAERNLVKRVQWNNKLGDGATDLPCGSQCTAQVESNSSYHIQNNHIKGKMLHPPSDILPMMNLITCKTSCHSF